jgi:nucleotide-binding universal stress UspA family protein
MIALKHIVVATDFGEAASNALAYGRELARRFDARLHILHVVDDLAARMMTGTGLLYNPGATEAALEVARKRLNVLVTEQDRRELQVETAAVAGTAPATEITNYAGQVAADLIVLGTHGRGPIGHMLMGNVAEHVVRSAPCPVLTVHRREREFIQPDALQTVSAIH